MNIQSLDPFQCTCKVKFFLNRVSACVPNVAGHPCTGASSDSTCSPTGLAIRRMCALYLCLFIANRKKRLQRSTLSRLYMVKEKTRPESPDEMRHGYILNIVGRSKRGGLVDIMDKNNPSLVMIRCFLSQAFSSSSHSLSASNL